MDERLGISCYAVSSLDPSLHASVPSWLTQRTGLFQPKFFMIRTLKRVRLNLMNSNQTSHNNRSAVTKPLPPFVSLTEPKNLILSESMRQI